MKKKLNESQKEVKRIFEKEMDWNSREVFMGEAPKPTKITTNDEIKIIRLFLEKLETMSEEERRTIIKAIQFINNPLFIINGNK